MTATIGIDPGRTGGAVLIDERSRLIWAASWRPCSVGYRVDMYSEDESCSENLIGQASDVGVYLSIWAADVMGEGPALDRKPLQLACEDVFVHRQRPNIRSSISLARWSGGIMGPLEIYANKATSYYQAAVWRRSILGLSPFTKREAAKAAALRYIPAMVPGLSAALEALGSLDHLADAAGIALHRQRT